MSFATLAKSRQAIGSPWSGTSATARRLSGADIGTPSRAQHSALASLRPVTGLPRNLCGPLSRIAAHAELRPGMNGNLPTLGNRAYLERKRL